MRFLGIILLILGIGSSCVRPFSTNDGPTIHLTALSIVDATPEDMRPARLEPDEIVSVITQQLTKAGFQVELAQGDAPKDPSAWQVRLSGDIIYGLQGEKGMATQVIDAPGKLVMRISAVLIPPQERESLRALMLVERAEQYTAAKRPYRAALQSWLSEAAQELGERIKQKARIYSLPPPKLVGLLDAEDRNERLDAAERISALRLGDAVDNLAARVVIETDREVKLRLIGAIAEVGDERAAKALISIADTRDREMLGAVLDALSSVGGERVEEFLGILSMHDSVQIRDMVESARTRLKNHAVLKPSQGLETKK